MGRRAQPGQVPRLAEEQRARAHAGDRPAVAPAAQVVDAARVAEERPRPETARHDEQIQRREIPVYLIGNDAEPGLVGDRRLGADDREPDRGRDAHRCEAAQRIVHADQVEQGEAREDEKADPARCVHEAWSSQAYARTEAGRHDERGGLAAGRPLE